MIEIFLSLFLFLCLSLSRFLLSGSTCKNAVIWDTQKPRSPPSLLVGHDNEVTAVAWCPTQLDKVTYALMLCRKFELIPIIFGFFMNF